MRDNFKEGSDGPAIIMKVHLFLTQSRASDEQLYVVSESEEDEQLGLNP